MRRDLPPRRRGSRCNLHDPAAPLHVIINNHKHVGPTINEKNASGAVALERHLAPALAARLPLAALQRAAATCGLATGVAYARRRRPCKRQPCPRVAVPVGGCPCKGVLAVAGRPLTGGLGRSRLPFTTGLAVGG
ncbi:hypothetical protein GW17_00053118 [Ensete ventricosum]|nr:hypothetical protein GW17_00053118 [Ensete ventricosum]